ncbi:MAG TPA: hypothetical protein VMS89_09950 [Methanoregulaceae archaeon]|nr:hypothetical protein [Methanoregulaceae archaeon]
MGDGTHQWLLILVATLFNLLFEYSCRGSDTLSTNPLLFPTLFALYFSLFTLVEDLIVRFRLRDYHFLIMAFFYGTIYEFFARGSALSGTGFLGIDWVTLVFANIVMWASVQGILTFYLATRVFPRGPHTPLLGERGWIIALIVNFSALALLHAGNHIPPPGITPMLVLVAILIVTGIIFRSQANKTKWRSAYVPFRKSTILDLLCLFTIVIFLFSIWIPVHGPANPYSALNNVTAWRISMVWACVVAVVLFIYRVLKGEPIPV